jgi:hypothetical protein
MINYLSSNLSVSIYQFHYTELNSLTNKIYNWNGQLIVMAAFYNYTDVNFQALNLYDSTGSHILHTAATHTNCYSVCYSGNNSGTPLYNLPLSNLNSIRFSWNIATTSTGSLMAKVYYI